MSQENAGGAGDENAGGNNQGNQQENENSDEKHINPDDHKRAIDDMHKYKTRWKESDSRIETLETEIKDLRHSKLQEKEDYKGMYETSQEELETTKAKNVKLKDSVLYGERHRAVFPSLKKAGLRDDATNLIEMENLQDVDVEITSEGRFLINGVDSWVERFKAKHPYAFEQKKTPNINSSGGSQQFSGNEELTPSSLYALELECKKKGNMQSYYDGVAKYKKQQSG